MLFLISLIIAFAFAFLCGKALKKYPTVFYIGAVIITILLAILPSFDTHNLPDYINNYVLGLFTRGALATALWVVVMITGALPNGSAPIKKLMQIRGELSIFTAILTLGHNIGYGRTYFTMLFTNADRMRTNQIIASICTIVMLCIMIPLTVISFPKIRKKMNLKLWKKIQRLAYIFYALIYIHVMLLTLPLARIGRSGYAFSVFLYSFVFFGYAFFRARKYIQKKETAHKKLLVGSGGTVAVIGVCLITISAFSDQEKQIQTETKNNNIQSFSISTTTYAETTETFTTSTVATTTSKSVLTENSTSDTTTTETTTETTTSDSSEETDDIVVTETEIVEEDDVTEPGVVETTQPPIIEPEIPPEPEYIYNNGDFSASAYGYDGDVYVTITIENDVITNISGYSEESDTWYFDSASSQVIPAILNFQNTDVDAYSGATYSSNAIMEAVRKALDSAKK